MVKNIKEPKEKSYSYKLERERDGKEHKRTKRNIIFV